MEIKVVALAPLTRRRGILTQELHGLLIEFSEVIFDVMYMSARLVFSASKNSGC